MTPNFAVWLIMTRHPKDNNFYPWDGERAFPTKELAEQSLRSVQEVCGFDSYIQMYGPIS